VGGGSELGIGEGFEGDLGSYAGGVAEGDGDDWEDCGHEVRSLKI
jgi:hypothetical protein